MQQIKRVPESLTKVFKEFAKSEHMSVSAFVLRLLEREVEQRKFYEKMKRRKPQTINIDVAHALAEARAEAWAELEAR